MSSAPDPHKPLRDDVRLLGELLGQAIRLREGERSFALVERVRALAKSGRAGATDAFDTLASELGAMPVDEVLPVARAFSGSPASSSSCPTSAQNATTSQPYSSISQRRITDVSSPPL